MINIIGKLKIFNDHWLNVNLKSQHSFIEIIGPNGSGKSTLIRAILGLGHSKPLFESLILNHQTLESISNNTFVITQKRKLAWIPQEPVLHPLFSIQKNILMTHSSKTRYDFLIQKLHLEKKQALYPHQLSGGERQRATIARALAQDTIAVMFDEAFSNLDRDLKSEISQFVLSDLTAHKRIGIFINHDDRIFEKEAHPKNGAENLVHRWTIDNAELKSQGSMT